MFYAVFASKYAVFDAILWAILGTFAGYICLISLEEDRSTDLLSAHLSGLP